MSIQQPRIGIIGGGASGLAAGHYLYKNGYQNITVLEKEPHLGGKCTSVEYEGEEYDLGGDYVTPTYTQVLAMAQEVGAELTAVPSRHSYDFADQRYHATISSVMSGVNPVAFLVACVRYWRLQRKYRGLQTPGFMGVPRELCVPFGQWMRQQGLGALENLFTIPLKIFGYVIEYDDIPAAYVVKYLNTENFLLLIGMGLGLSKSWPKRFVKGFQNFWELVARPLTIHTNTHIQQITRGDVVRVTAADGRTFEFDQIILACPFDQALQFLDATPTETTLFSQILYNDYYTTTCVMSQMPAGLQGYGNIDELPIPGVARPWAMLRAWGNRDLISCFSLAGTNLTAAQMAAPPVSKAEVTQWVEHDLAAVGGRVDHLLTQNRWPYFPHVSAETMRNGYYDQLERLQGQNNTYYAWALLNFETVHNTVEYAQFLVKRFFPARVDNQ